MPTRTCCHCHTPIPTTPQVLVQTLSSTATRNNYYCQACWSSQTLPCTICSTRLRRASPTTIRASIRLITDLRTHLHLPAIPLSPANSAICTHCALNNTWRCTSCGYTFCNHLAPRPDGGMCTHCAGSLIPCVRCGLPRNTRTDRIQSANTRFSDYIEQGLILCPGCVTAPVPPTTFLINPSARTVGYEIEMVVPVRAVDKLRDLYKYGHVHGDGSINIAPRDSDPDDFSDDDEDPLDEATTAAERRRERSARTAWELVSYPASGDKLLENIDAISGLLTKYKCFTNGSCGLHCHFGMTNESAAGLMNIQQWWNELQEVFFMMVRADRRDNGYCRRGIGTTDRYYALNTIALARHGTYEIRLHHGWEDAETLKGWIIMLLSFFDTFSKIPHKKLQLKSLREQVIFFMQQCQVPLRIRRYMVRALRKHSNLKRLRTGTFRKPDPNAPNQQQQQPTVTTTSDSINMSTIEALNRLHAQMIGQRAQRIMGTATAWDNYYVDSTGLQWPTINTPPTQQ